MAGLVPAIPIRAARSSPKRDRRDKPGDDGRNCSEASDYQSGFKLKTLQQRSLVGLLAVGGMETGYARRPYEFERA
jgi:hypothetical protein